MRGRRYIRAAGKVGERRNILVGPESLKEEANEVRGGSKVKTKQVLLGPNYIRGPTHKYLGPKFILI